MSESSVPAEESKDLHGDARRGSRWSLVGYGGQQLIRFASNLVMTRLLVETDYGLSGHLALVMTAVHLFSDLGIGPSIVQNERGNDPRFLATAWTIQCARGVALWLIATAVAFPYAWFYEIPVLTTLMPVTALSAVIGGLTSTRIWTANRALSMRSIALFEIGAAILSVGTMLGWALFDRSVWALVVGSVAGPFWRTILSHLVFPGPRDRFAWDRDAVRRLVSLGRWVFLSTALTFFVMHADKAIFGKLIPLEQFGVYTVAATLSGIAPVAIAHVSLNVLFPAFAAMHRRGDALGPAFRSLRRTWLVLGGLGLSGLIGGGQAAVDLLYDARWSNAGWMLQLLSIGGWLSIVEAQRRSVSLAVGQAQWMALAGGMKLAAMVVFIPLGHSIGGFFGAVAGYAASELLQYLGSLYGSLRVGVSGVMDDVLFSVWVAVVSVAGHFIVVTCKDAALHPVLVAVAVAAGAVALWSPLLVGLVRARRAVGSATAEGRAP